MRKLTNYEKDLKREMKNPEFRKAFQKEGRRLAIAYQIHLLRKQKRFTQKKLAEKLGTTQSVIARIEAGEENVTLDTLHRIADAFRKTLQIKFV